MLRLEANLINHRPSERNSEIGYVARMCRSRNDLGSEFVPCTIVGVVYNSMHGEESSSLTGMLGLLNITSACLTTHVFELTMSVAT